MKKTTALRHRVGSLLIVGVESTLLSELELAWLRSLQPSGIILFRRNIETTTQIHALWKQATGSMAVPFFRCVDLEGGTVDRLRDLVGPTSSAAEVAATDQSAIARQSGALVGRMLHALGFNLDLAPVLDLALPASREVMRTRVVSSDPANVIAYAREFIAGLKQHGIIACGKHFPGLGGGTLDSHQATPSIDRTWEQMWEHDMEPYRALRTALPLVMVSHAAYPKIEKPSRPASLSHFWIEEVLRAKLRYRGLVISDDMEMGGVLNHASAESAAIEAIAAGTDLLEICHRADRVLATHEALLIEAERSPAFARTVDRAARRVASAKLRLLKGSVLPRSLSAAGLRQLQLAQERLRAKIARATPEATE
ncbi:MAG TPA: beta-N-acetylhexosaminidase [Acidobacteriaceae bacterium]|nr:beta-N-acetylhexosaminidase [Acidobacteriaceae bacterium]